MFSTQALIDAEKATLDGLGKKMPGSELAAFVAKRTRLYLIQEIERSLRRAKWIHSADEAADHVKGYADF